MVPYQIMPKTNRKFADDSVWIKDNKIQIGWGFATASDLVSYLYGITGNDILIVQGNLWITPWLSKNRSRGYKIVW